LKPHKHSQAIDIKDMKISPLKLKVAIFFGYNGTKFYGLQKIEENKLPTVEGALEKALHEIGLIPAFNYGDLSQSGWGRGSRTDRGVHAALNTVKCKVFIPERFLKKEGEGKKEEVVPETKDSKDEVIEENDVKETKEETQVQDEQKNHLFKKKEFVPRKSKVDWDLVIKELNAVIDPDVKVFAFRIVVKAFDLRQSARSRKYEYIFPAHLLNCQDTEGKSTQEKLEYFNVILKRYKGNHNFHNYTWKGDPLAKSSDRYILDVRAEFLNPAIIGEDAKLEEFVIIYLHGQSFLYNQIRKMVGAVLQVLHLGLGEAFLDNTFLRNKIEMWLAPSQGLLLDRVK